MRLHVSAALLALLLALVGVSTSVLAGAGLYSPRDHVVELTAANFQSEVVKSNQVWLVEFYAPWCGHCKNLAPEWVKAANALAGVVRVGAVNMDEHQSVGAPYDIRGFPTIKVFGANKQSPSTYEGARQAKDIVEFGLKEAQAVVRARLSGKTKSTSSSSSSSGSNGGSTGGAGNGKVIDATESTFQSEVIDNDDVVLVEFFAPWCGHCKALAPEWKRAASTLGGVAKLVAVDCTVHQQLAQKYGIRGYPTIKVFKPGKKHAPEDYNGGRTAGDIVTYAKNVAEANAKPKSVVEVTSKAVLEEHCREKASLCLVTVVPHILDGGAKARNAILATLRELASKYKSRPFSFVWLEAGSQSGLEESLLQGNTFFPAVAALNWKKGRMAPMVGSFTVEAIGDFLNRLLSGRESTQPIDVEKLTIAERSAWDGKDGQMPVERASDEL